MVSRLRSIPTGMFLEILLTCAGREVPPGGAAETGSGLPRHWRNLVQILSPHWLLHPPVPAKPPWIPPPAREKQGKSRYFGPDVSAGVAELRLSHLLQRGLQAPQVGPQVPTDQLPDAVPMAMDHVTCGAAVVVAVQRGGTVQTDGQVTWLAEEPELLARVEGAEDGPAEAPAGLQLFEAANGVRRRPLLPPGETEETSEQTVDWSQWSPVLRLPRARSKESFPHSPEFGIKLAPACSTTSVRAYSLILHRKQSWFMFGMCRRAGTCAPGSRTRTGSRSTPRSGSPRLPPRTGRTPAGRPSPGSPGKPRPGPGGPC